MNHKYSDDENIKILAVGDIMLGISSLRAIADKNTIPNLILQDNKSIIKDILPSLKKKDILFGNLESPISNQFDWASLDNPKLIMAPGEAVSTLKYCNFDVLNIANNHTLDYGTEVFDETIQFLKKENIRVIGNHAKANLETIKVKNITIGFMGYNLCDEGNKSSNSNIYSDINNYKQLVDILVISLHWGWGMEHSFIPSKEQIELGHKLIDMGVDVILGHHSHVFQHVEIYNGKIIAYSLGNFIFDMWRDENIKGGILEIMIDSNKNLEANIIPTIQDKFSVKIDSEMMKYKNKLLTTNINETINNLEIQNSQLNKKHNKEILLYYILHIHKFSFNFHINTISRWTKKIRSYISDGGFQ
ncbi:CapA family protein [Methanogenium sp. MK-MG]|uniref:CapA family protein n=1 Tax=Methanogenium sp. MK-MG TaxID=2599926 RepID=UPI0013EB402E|nr:CapA family protein [Methanogenium sp. MK-MG]KAF1079011.1 hypothetical protein MKMG_00019 [Methanogenium sp. MK-MG]